MMQIKKLLYAMDVRQSRSAGIQRLMDLRSLGLEEIVFLHSAKGKDREKTLEEYDIAAKALVADGPLVRGILKTAREEAVSLIAVSLSSNEGGRLRRSLTRNLLKASPVPVIILPENGETLAAGQQGIFAHVVFATDWSPASEKALGYLLGFKDIIKELEIVNVIQKRLSIRDMRDLKERLAQTRKRLLDGGIDAESHIYAGKPCEEIMLAAKDYGATCIVMGGNSKSGLKGIMSRSYCYRVAGASIVPTMVVR